MKKGIIVNLFLLLSFTCNAATLTEKADTDYFETLHKIESIKNQSQKIQQRQLLFDQLANDFVNGNPTQFITIKQGFLEILIENPQFFFNGMSRNKDAYTLWKEKFNLHWIKAPPNKYNELKESAIKHLKAEILHQKNILRMEQEVLKLINETPVTTLD